MKCVCRIAVVVSRRCGLCWVAKVEDSAVNKFLATVCLEDEDGLGVWFRS